MAELQALQDAVQAHGHQVSALKDKLEALRRRLPPTPKPPSGEHAPAAPALPALSAAEKLVALEHRTQLQAGQQQQPPTPPAAERPAAAQQQNQEQEPAVLPRRLRRHRKNWRQLPGGLEGVLVHESPGLTVVKVSERPCVLVVDRFLSAADCGELIRRVQPCLQRSQVAGPQPISPGRTSWSFWLPACACPAAEEGAAPCCAGTRLDARILELARVAAALQQRPALDFNAEDPQVARYLPGQEFTAHLDAFAHQPAERGATLHLFLSNVKDGGGTVFSRARPPAPLGFGGSTAAAAPIRLRIPPKRGRAVMWWNCVADGSRTDPDSEHAGEVVVQGEKWTCTQWLRQQHAPGEGKPGA